MLYARKSPDTGEDDIRNFDAVPPIAKGWLPLVIDAQPTPSASQLVTQGPILYSATEAHQTWALRDKTAEEIAREADASERDQIKAAAVMDLLRAEAAGTSTLTAAQSRKLFARCVLWLVNRQ